ncbi:MAG: hypothetical protein DMG39_18840 [Acidobacteria bacterium]|nr:MAG: hypothetical protein DMG39_18840 [Acidobacteriota bacterium]
MDTFPRGGVGGSGRREHLGSHRGDGQDSRKDVHPWHTSCSAFGVKRASLLVNLKGRVERFPCIVIDRSKGGLRLRGSFHLRRGQAVEVTFDDDLLRVRCQVIWVREGEAGLASV